MGSCRRSTSYCASKLLSAAGFPVVSDIILCNKIAKYTLEDLTVGLIFKNVVAWPS